MTRICSVFLLLVLAGCASPIYDPHYYDNRGTHEVTICHQICPYGPGWPGGCSNTTVCTAKTVPN